MAGGLRAAPARHALLAAALLAGGCMTVDIPERRAPAPAPEQPKTPPPRIVEPPVAPKGARTPDTPPVPSAPPGSSASPVNAPPSTAPGVQRAPTAGPSPEPAIAAPEPSPKTPAPPGVASPHAMDFGARATEIALGMMGRPYVLGGITPDGFDCSGLVYYSFGRLGVSVPRDTQGLRDITTQIPDRLRRIGDLVFFHIHGKQFSHVGFYVGEGRFLHAPTAGGEVRIEKLSVNYWARRYAGTRRLAFAPVNSAVR